MTAQLPNDLLNCIWKLQFPLMNKRVARLAKKYFSFWYTGGGVVLSLHNASNWINIFTFEKIKLYSWAYLHPSALVFQRLRAMSTWSSHKGRMSWDEAGWFLGTSQEQRSHHLKMLSQYYLSWWWLQVRTPLNLFTYNPDVMKHPLNQVHP